MAERVGFEPTVELPPHTLSKRAPSATRTPLHGTCEDCAARRMIVRGGRGSQRGGPPAIKCAVDGCFVPASQNSSPMSMSFGRSGPADRSARRDSSGASEQGTALFLDSRGAPMKTQLFHTFVHSVSHRELSMLGRSVNRPQHFVSLPLTGARVLASLRPTRPPRRSDPNEAFGRVAGSGVGSGWNPIHERETAPARAT